MIGVESGSLRAARVTLEFGDSVVLSGVDFEVTPAESVAIVGPSGAGKSSLLAVLAGLLVPSRGSVSLANTVISALDEQGRRAVRLRNFGFVFQAGDLMPELTVAQNVALPLLLQNVHRNNAYEAAVEMLARLEIQELADRTPAEVSGGQRQRVAVARALVHRPPFVLADEPTGSLDDQAARLVQDELLAHASRQKAAVVVVTHDLRLARRCGRMIYLDRGRLVAVEPTHA